MTKEEILHKHYGLSDIERLVLLRKYLENLSRIMDNPEYHTLSVLIQRLYLAIGKDSSYENLMPHYMTIQALSELEPQSHVVAYVWGIVHGIIYMRFNKYPDFDSKITSNLNIFWADSKAMNSN